MISTAALFFIHDILYTAGHVVGHSFCWSDEMIVGISQGS